MAEQAEDVTGNRDSVFDFIYTDYTRMSALISQFNEMGPLTGILETRFAEKASEKGDQQSFKGSVAVAGVTADISSKIKSAVQKSNDKSYDPRWVNALNFLDTVFEMGILKELGDARVGDLVLMKGSLGRVDKRDSQLPLGMIQAGICDGDQLGTRPDVGRGMGVL